MIRTLTLPERAYRPHRSGVMRAIPCSGLTNFQGQRSIVAIGITTLATRVGEITVAVLPTAKRIASGYLVITAKRESKGNSDYTSARIRFSYGRRHPPPCLGPEWPALWALGSNTVGHIAARSTSWKWLAVRAERTPCTGQCTGISAA